MSGRERSRAVSGVSRRDRLSIMIAAFLPQHDFRLIVEIRFRSLRGFKRNGDLDEVAGATDAIACSSRSHFLRSNSWFLGDNSARRAAHELLVNPGSATPEAIKQRNGH